MWKSTWRSKGPSLGWLFSLSMLMCLLKRADAKHFNSHLWSIQLFWLRLLDFVKIIKGAWGFCILKFKQAGKCNRDDLSQIKYLNNTLGQIDYTKKSIYSLFFLSYNVFNMPFLCILENRKEWWTGFLETLIWKQNTILCMGLWNYDLVIKDSRISHKKATADLWHEAVS